jgi:hypothetical protein
LSSSVIEEYPLRILPLTYFSLIPSSISKGIFN